ncbi:secreted protein [Melampsora americana]|nr:secreted protein [Melampsora americana]
MLARHFLLGIVCLVGSIKSDPEINKKLTPTHEVDKNFTINYEEVFQNSSISCINTVEVVKTNSKKGDQLAVYKSIETFHSHVKIIEETVQHVEFDNKSATIYSEHVAEVVISYSKVVTTLVDYPSIEKGCHGKLKEVKISVQRIIDAYDQVGVCVKKVIEKQGGIDSITLSSLNLQLNFIDLEVENQSIEFKENPHEKKNLNGNHTHYHDKGEEKK